MTGTTGTSDGQSVAVRQYFEVPRRRWRIVLAVALIGVAAVVGYAQLASGRYEASTIVRVNPIGTDPFTSGRTADQLVNTDSEAQLARSSEVAEAAAELLSPAGDPETMRAGLTVTAASDTASLTLSYAGDSRQDAVDGANAFAQAYLEHREAEARDQQRQMLDNVEESLGEARDDLIAAEDALAAAEAGSREVQEADADRQIADRSIQSLSTRRGDLQSLVFEPGTVLREAEQAAPASFAGGPAFLVGGALAALVLALLAAFARDGLDRRVRSGHDVSRAVRAPLLAEIPGGPGAPLLEDPDGDAAESYRVLRAHLMPALRRADIRVLLVADLTQGRAGTAGAALAVALAQAHSGVALLIPGWSNPGAAGLAALGEGGGFSSLMPGAVPGMTSPADTLRSTSVPGLRAAYGGDVRSLLGSGHFDALVAELTTTDGYVVLDASGQLSRSETLAMAGAAGAAVVVGQRGRTLSPELSALATDLERLGTPVAGCAVVTTARRGGGRTRAARHDAAPAPAAQKHRRPEGSLR
jgi:capsular polysaccharide biosynthesis protein